MESERVMPTATQAPPGSEEKLAILRLRWERGELLWHPNDRRIEWERATMQCESISLNGLFETLRERQKRWDDD